MGPPCAVWARPPWRARWSLEKAEIIITHIEPDLERTRSLHQDSPFTQWTTHLRPCKLSANSRSRGGVAGAIALSWVGGAPDGGPRLHVGRHVDRAAAPHVTSTSFTVAPAAGECQSRVESSPGGNARGPVVPMREPLLAQDAKLGLPQRLGASRAPRELPVEFAHQRGPRRGQAPTPRRRPRSRVRARRPGSGRALHGAAADLGRLASRMLPSGSIDRTLAIIGLPPSIVQR